MALTSRKRLLLALIGLLLLPDHNEARVLSETRVGYADDSASVGPSAPPTSSPVINQQPVVRPPVATQPKQNQSFSVKIPVLESQPEVPEPTVVPEPALVPEPAVVPAPEGSVREDLESGLLQELEQEKKQMIERTDVPLTDNDSSELPETSIMRIIGLGLEDEAIESAEIKVADGNEPAADTMNTAVSNEIDLIGREMSRIMHLLLVLVKPLEKRF